MTMDIISSLPTEMLMEIFSHLDTQSAQRCTRVSTLFREILTTITGFWVRNDRQLYQIIDHECEITPFWTMKHIVLILSKTQSVSIIYCPGYSRTEFKNFAPNERMKKIKFVTLTASKTFAFPYTYPVFPPFTDSMPTFIDQAGLSNAQGVLKTFASVIHYQPNVLSGGAFEETRKKITSILNKNIEKNDRWVIALYTVIAALFAQMVIFSFGRYE